MHFIEIHRNTIKILIAKERKVTKEDIHETVADII